jgi:hypothetical protein
MLRKASNGYETLKRNETKEGIFMANRSNKNEKIRTRLQESLPWSLSRALVRLMKKRR